MSKLKLIRLSVDKKYIWYVRVVMFLAATPFLLDLYQVFMIGIIQDGRTIATYEDGKLFYSIIVKKLAFAMFFLWLCTGGVVANTERSEN